MKENPRTFKENTKDQALKTANVFYWPFGVIGRGQYLAAMIVVWLYLFMTSGLNEDASVIYWIVFALTLLAGLFLTASRLLDIGYSGLWSLLIFFPYANLFIAFCCLVLPHKFRSNKRIDAIGWVILSVLLFLMFVYAAGIFSQ